VTESSRIRKSIRASRAVKVWFWDTVREYSGQAVELGPGSLVCLLRMGGTGMATVIPNKNVMAGLIKHLSGRVVEFRITGMSLEVACKGTITSVQPDFENPRRLLLFAALVNVPERSAQILKTLGGTLAR
jgi:hypothetical protein